MQKGAGNVYPAALAAGELAYAAVKQVGKIEKLTQLPEPILERFARYAVQRRAAFEIIAHRQRLIQDAALEHDTEPARYPGNVLIRIEAGDLHAAAVGLQLAAHDGDGGRFACAVYAEKGEQLAGADVKGQVIDGLHAAESFIKMRYFDYMLIHRLSLLFDV